MFERVISFIMQSLKTATDLMLIQSQTDSNPLFYGRELIKTLMKNVLIFNLVVNGIKQFYQFY